ncbi:MAG: fumarylacetoacetate hydrolase [Gammaproteobacteria bacterium]|nr:fumarylacetoacetate hydrolase [Gammaproteobacteria bacterium]HJL95647.1 fumarylacetoacetate hydrolase family protein [SAR86 cluster bacterium]
MSFKLANIVGRAALIDGENYYDLETISNGDFDEDTSSALNNLEGLKKLSSGLSEAEPTGSLKDVRIDAPVSAPKNCFAVGLNYRNHAEEAGMDIPVVPMIFTKHTTCLVGPNSDIEMRSDHVDYEAELVVVIGKPGKDINKDNAWDHVAGLCIGQDISDRKVQFSSKPPQFNLGKSFDTFGPIGPYLVSPDGLKDKQSLQIECKVNEEIRQKDNTNDLIFDIPSIISYLSEIVTLNTGDVIFTGTPGGVGVMEGKFLKEGDIVTTSIKGLGVLKNTCKRISNHSNVDKS